ncbi:hypothetical protein QQ045_016544 [Rhodiola kirilowii]
MMAHLLTPTAPATPATPISALLSAKKMCNTIRPLRLTVPVSDKNDAGIDRRSTVIFGLVAGAVLAGLSLSVGDESANAAGRRPPPKPPAEKKDPNISGLAAKILASKKRKEEMKEAVAKQRQRGKPVVVN